MPFRLFEQKVEELEELQRELQDQVEELEEEMEHLKRQQLMESEAKSKLRQESSRLTAENMVCICDIHLFWDHPITNPPSMSGLRGAAGPQGQTDKEAAEPDKKPGDITERYSVY